MVRVEGCVRIQHYDYHVSEILKVSNKKGEVEKDHMTRIGRAGCIRTTVLMFTEKRASKRRCLCRSRAHSVGPYNCEDRVISTAERDAAPSAKSRFVREVYFTRDA